MNDPMPTKIRNIIFIIICICALSIAFIYVGAKKMNVLPASYNNGTYSYLEGAKLQTRPKLTLSSIKKGTFQTQTEKWLTTKVPKRDSVMLLNAKVQRGMIKVANLACGFETIPTYYGSMYSCNESLNAVFYTSVQKSDEISQKMQMSAEAINKFVEEHPNLTYTLAIPDIIRHSEASPTFSLTSNPIDDEWRHSEFVDKLDPRIKYVDLTYADTNDYYEKYFRTDHHWNIEGAYEAFRKIMNASYPELDALTFTEYDKVTYQEPKFFGTGSRSGLYIPKVSDLISDYITDLSSVSIKIDGKEVASDEVEDVEKYTNKTYAKEELIDRHSDYFHVNKGLVTYHRESGNSRNLLIFGDSYLSSCDRFYAFSFDNVVKVDQQKFKGSLQKLIEENNITDVLFEQNDTLYYDGTSPDDLIKLLES